MKEKASNNKKTNPGRGKRIALWAVIVFLVVVLLAVLLIWWALDYTDRQGAADVPAAPATEPAIQETVPPVTLPEPEVEQLEDTAVHLDAYMTIVNVASYTGAFVEDGSNEIVSGVLMLVVENISENDIQYAEITLPTAAGEAKFSLSTLPAGESVVLLEQNRMAYTGSEDVTKAVSDNVAVFSEALSLQEDRLKLQILDGAINVINISGADIDGDIIIYYKNAAADLYYGGITYRVRIEGGMKADEIKQIMASHFDQAGSRILFVTVG